MQSMKTDLSGRACLVHCLPAYSESIWELSSASFWSNIKRHEPQTLVASSNRDKVNLSGKSFVDDDSGVAAS